MIYAPEEHLGHLVLRENKAIRLARIPVNGDRLQDSVILHPRYVPQGVEHEIFIARAYRRGRTIDLFLDEPITVDGVEYGILNFKGVGAKADRLLVIQPDDWYTSEGVWIPRKRGDLHGRVWGALTKGKARREYPARLFHKYDIYHAPHLALNEIPKEVKQFIRRSEGATERHNLVQLVRGLQTNIRFDEYHLLTDEQQEQINIADLAKVDALLIKAQFALAERGKMLGYVGRFDQNRFIDGRYTDAENLYTGEFEWWGALRFLEGVAGHFGERCNNEKKESKYYRALEKETGISFTSSRCWQDIRDILKYELGEVTKGKYIESYLIG